MTEKLKSYAGKVHKTLLYLESTGSPTTLSILTGVRVILLSLVRSILMVVAAVSFLKYLMQKPGRTPNTAPTG